MRKINVDIVIKYILLFMSFYLGQTGVINYAKYPNYSIMIMLSVFLCILLIFCYFFCVRGKKLSFFAIYMGGVCCINYVLTMVINSDWRGSYVLLCINVISAIAFSCIYEREEFYKIYVDCICIISLLGIIATYFILPAFMQFIPIIETAGGIKYYDMVFSFPIIHAEKYRLNAIWTEPGMMAAYLMFAIVFELFLLKTRKKICVILIVAMLLTRSSTGYVLLLLILATSVLNYILENGSIMPLVIAFVGFILCVGMVYILYPKLLIEITSKYSGNSINFIGRFAPMLYNMDMWTKSPWIGVGFHEGMFRVNYEMYRGVLFSNTSTTTLLLHNFGVLLPILSILATWKICTFAKSHKMITVLLAIILVLGVNFENQVLDQLYIIILFSIYMIPKGMKKNENTIAQYNSNM